MISIDKDTRLIYRETLDLFGPHAQTDMVQEECGELITAINHRRRGRITTSRVLEEVADVVVCLEQYLMVLRSDRGASYDELMADFEFAYNKSLAKMIHKNIGKAKGKT